MGAQLEATSRPIELQVTSFNAVAFHLRIKIYSSMTAHVLTVDVDAVE